ncbi:MAG TPA: DUF1800 family protein, partial [Solirubrobacteraceae bacterium]|nr:DUF1800 family protein [Solirubrobacteraceae bacterium]
MPSERGGRPTIAPWPGGDWMGASATKSSPAASAAADRASQLKRARDESSKTAHTKHKKHHRPSKHHKHHKHHKHPVHRTASGFPGASAPLAIPPHPPPPSSSPPPALGAAISLAQARRLLWRAGFGPRPGEAEQLAGQPIEAVVQSLTRPAGPAVLVGPQPVDDEGHALEPASVWGEDHCWWLDRMVRSDQQLVERMTFIWHDWFANSNEKVNSQQRMLDQNNLFRAHALGSFHDLFLAVTTDPAMLVFLDGIYNDKDEPNENYAREMMELFSLGPDRGAYTETDVREMARALTGWTAEWTESSGLQNFRFDSSRHDATAKTVF